MLLQVRLAAALIACIADPFEQCRLATLQLLTSPECSSIKSSGLLLPAIAQRFGKAVGEPSDGAPADTSSDSSEDVRLAAVQLLAAWVRKREKLSASELEVAAGVIQIAMADAWVDVRKVFVTITIALECECCTLEMCRSLSVSSTCICLCSLPCTIADAVIACRRHAVP